MELFNASLDASPALNAEGVIVGANLSMNGLSAKGCIRLSGGKIHGGFECERLSIQGDDWGAIIGQSLLVEEGLIFREVKEISGAVLFNSAHVADLVDDFSSWAQIDGDLELDGFSYDRLSGAPWSISCRLRWLEQGSRYGGTFSPQPYTQLAKTLAAMGHNRAARRVLYERELHIGRAERSLANKNIESTNLLPLRKLWVRGKNLFHLSGDLLSRTVVGYGHKPWMALLWMIGLWFAATWLAHAAWINGDFAPNSDVMLVSDGWLAQLETPNPAEAWSSKGAAGQDWESFNRYAWGLDLVVPILDIGQTDAWQPSRDCGPDGYRLWWARWLLQGMGWLVSALGVAAITGIMQKDRD